MDVILKLATRSATTHYMSDSVVSIDAALAAGDVAGAVVAARTALAEGDTDPFVLNLVAWDTIQTGDPIAAEAMIRGALATPPHDPGLLTTLGLALRRQLRFSEALRAFDAAIAEAPDYAVAWLERGFTLHQGNSLRLADASYRRAAMLDAHQAPAFAGVASIAASQGETAVAREFAGKALAIDPHDAVAHCAIARCDTAGGDPGASVDRLQALLQHPGLTAENHSAAQSLLGDALAKVNRPADAVAAYISAKSSLTARFPHLLTVERQLRLAERLTAEVTADTGNWSATGADDRRGHGFLLGFPRSGTTLIETILASVVGVEALEELPTLAAAEAAYLAPADGTRKLAEAKIEAMATMRSAYWHRVADFGVDTNARMFIDMDPMKSLDLPLIGRLFGTAHIIVMRRDPRDVVLSCFRQNFAASPMALEFTTLERTAHFYDATMQLQCECLARLPNPVLELWYEELIDDFDGVTQQLCSFLGLPWSEKLRDFSDTARRRDVSTASVGQVRQGLFNGSGQWRRFETEMAPVLPVLAPWVKLFGYDG